MALGTYTRYRDYSQAQVDSPATVLSGTDFDTDFDRVKTSLDSVVDAIEDVRNDDGTVKNASVGTDQLKSEIITLLNGVTPRGDWVTATAYAVTDLVRSSNLLYFCIVAHTSGTFATDLTAAKWMSISASSVASGVANTPAGSIAATTVQAAIDELDTEKQPKDATLTALAGVTVAADKVIYATGADAFSTTDLTAAARTVLDDTTTAAMLTTLGAVPLAGGTMTGALTLPGAPTTDLHAATKLYVDSVAGFPPKYMHGWAYANAAGDVTNDLDIPAGAALDATNAVLITGAALTKQSDVVWAVGNGQGMLDTGVVGNSDYYLWAIKRSDTGVVDYLCSLSSTAPTMPTSYDYKRLIGWFKRAGGLIVLFNTYETLGGGLEFKWRAPTLDVSLAATLTTSRRTDAVKVPLNFSTLALLTVVVYDAAALQYVRICCPDETDAAIDYTTAPGNNISAIAGNPEGRLIEVRTSSAGLVAARGNTATADLYNISTVGFVWQRR